MRDIAKLAGVSVASVSRILNNDETFSINEHTRQRVIEIANQMNYSKKKINPIPVKSATKTRLPSLPATIESRKETIRIFMMILQWIERKRRSGA